MRHVFLVPDPAALTSGGNLYNGRLLAALRDAGADVTLRPQPDDVGARYWVDSLYLETLPRLHRPARLIVHWLPSLVRRGALASPADLDDVERAAIDAAVGFLVPSAYMADVLARLGVARRPLAVVEPGVEVPAPQPLATHGPLRALVVANVVPHKRVLPLVRALGDALGDGDSAVDLTVAGSLALDREYAAGCRAAAAARFTGALPHETLLERLAASDVLVSPSCMESFGLALAEARALGVPIVARAGGNVAAHVTPAAGGRLCDDDAALVAEVRLLARDRAELARRRQQALDARPPLRTWADAARDFLDAQRRE